MIKCKNACPTGQFEGCCFECDSNDECKDGCVLNPANCGNSIIEEVSEETALEMFKQHQGMMLREIIGILSAKKQLEEQEKQLKEKLKEAMEFYGVKKFESNHLTITYVAETTTTTIDTSKLKKKYPEIAEECSRTSKKSAYVKITVKQ